MLQQVIRYFIGSSQKVYYPFFLASDYTQLEYETYYSQKAKHLQIDQPNINQVSFEYLNKFLISQIQKDKYSFLKEKEFLFVGRSNSGKSSIINATFENKRIARAAKRAGTTKYLHFHRIKNAGAMIVDAPGYGFAKMNRRRREMWFGLTEQYMKISSRLSQIFVCINFEHGLKENDKIFLQRADKFNVDIQIILTKVDKINEKKYFVQLQSIVQAIKRLELKNMNQRIIACSAKSKFGIQILRMRIVEAIDKSRQRNIDTKQDMLLAYLKEHRVQPAQLQVKQKQQTKEFLVRKLIYNSRLSKFLM